MNPASVFFRSGTIFPNRFSTQGKPAYDGWVNSDTGDAHQVDKQIRELGWHFIWLSPVSNCTGVGFTAAEAIDKAMRSGLHELKARFNTAEVITVKVKKYPGFHVARIQLASRHIQESASLTSAG